MNVTSTNTILHAFVAGHLQENALLLKNLSFVGEGMLFRFKVARNNLNQRFRFTILPGLSLDGILHCKVVEGSCNSWIFNEFLEDLFSEMNLYPERNSVLVLDNVTFHHNPQVQALASER